MKLVLKKSDTSVSEKLNIHTREVPCLDAAWHYHKEIELLYISKSNGIRFVGDSVAPFFPGDLVLVGSYLPHLWRNDPSYYQDDNIQNVQTIVTKFTVDFLGDDIFNMPEFYDIKKLIEDCKLGLSFGKSVSKPLHDDIMKLPNLSPAEQHIKILGILHKLSIVDKKDRVSLSSSDMRQTTTESSERIDTVLKYISDNYATSISLDDISNIACMTTNSFCRFFKKMTNKSFTQFLNEIRIRNASRILVQETMPVSEVCYIVGFNSITNFNKQFKQIMGSTPKKFREAI